MRVKNTKTFIEKAKQIHGDKYNYYKTIYVKSKEKVIITCPIHGDFEQEPNAHLNGQTCLKCTIELKKHNTKTFIEKAKQIHGDKYNYNKTIYIKSKEKVIITCPIHGDFEQTPANHLQGRGCIRCGNISMIDKLTTTTENFIIRAKQIHGDKYNYNKIKITKLNDYVIITCTIHGDFEQRASNHLLGVGCKKCAILKDKELKTKKHEQFISEVKLIHKNKYNYNKTVYIHSEHKIIITCPIHGDFEQLAFHHLQGSGCPLCAGNIKISKSEQEIYDFIKSVYSGPVEQSNRSVLLNKEIDIYLPDLKIGIEFNGLYWHNELNKSSNYHVEKTNACEDKDIHLIQIFENEWLDKKEIVKSRIKQILNVNKDKRIYGRQCYIKEVDTQTERLFLNHNHLQGYVASSHCYGLFIKLNNKEYLVALMSFGSSSREGVYEMYRFCNIRNHAVIGGANKLFKHFLKLHQPKEIISFANRRYSFIHKNLYKSLGFDFISTTKPNYYYVQGNKLIEKEIIKKLYKIFDSGYLLYCYKTKNIL